MRWRDREKGTKRTRKGFLWRRKKINGETRWLEQAEWEETWMPLYPHADKMVWRPTKWRNE